MMKKQIKESEMDLNKNEDARTAQLLQLLMLIALNYYVAEVFFVCYLFKNCVARVFSSMI